MTSNSSNDGSRVPPSFKKPTFKKPSFKKPSGGKVPPTLGDEEAKNMPTWKEAFSHTSFKYANMYLYAKILMYLYIIW